MPKVNKEAIREWVEALESGRYQQTTGTLAQYEENGSVGYCCLGVACDVFKERLNLTQKMAGHRILFDNTVASMPFTVSDFLGLPDTNVHWPGMNKLVGLTQLNDIYGLTFEEIATILRANFLEEEPMTDLNKAAIREWVEALESGEYQQTTGTLAEYRPDDTLGYCCLGVACDTFKDRLGLEVEERQEEGVRFLAFNNTSERLPMEVYKFLGLASSNPVVLSDDGPCALSYLNDKYGLTFEEIAAILRANFLGEEE